MILLIFTLSFYQIFVRMLQPTQSKERIKSLDFLRGFALLGILIMNIQGFSMPGASYINPTDYGDLTGINKWVWIFSHIFGDQKFMTIFSILYGAGIIMVTEKAESRTGKSAGLHYRRTFWLLIIGLIHAHLIWHGDILVPYAICAALAYFFRKMKPVRLLIIGILIILVHTAFYLFMGTSMEHWPPEALEGARSAWNTAPEEINEEIAALTGSISEQIQQNSATATIMETMIFLFVFLWRAGGLMLVGMALYKWGVLTAQKSIDFYKKGLVYGLLIGLPIVIYGVYANFKADFAFEYSMYIGSQYNYIGSLLVSFSFICGIMFIAKSDRLSWLQDRLAAIGQMALSNYVAQSLICTFIFYGMGLGLFGQVERSGQILIVFGVWIVLMLWSRSWLDRFQFGPLEWLWRSLTYWKRQGFKK
jgi:uncharacterized protein